MASAALTGYRKGMSDVQFLAHGAADLAFRHHPGSGPLVVFLPGYMSDMTGSKAEALAEWAAGRGRAYLRLDYSGCGASGGDFLDGSIGRWVADARAVIDHVAPDGRVVLVGSSMGGWVALGIGLLLGERLAGLIGIAAAPDFTDWGLAITDDDRAALAGQGWFARPSDYDAGGYRYSRALIEDAPAQALMGGTIAIDAPVRLLHGQRDDAVPWRLALDIADRLRSDAVQVTLIKDGDHRLSRAQDIALLIRAVTDLAEDP
jgi:pimeloyl-ACP methyl ester carboxylesterase